MQHEEEIHNNDDRNESGPYRSVRKPLPRELAWLDQAMRNAQRETSVIGALLAEHTGYFAVTLHLTPDQLLGYRDVPDEQAARDLGTRVECAMRFARINQFAIPKGTPKVLRTFLGMLRRGEIGATNLGEFVAEHAENLGPLLRTPPDILRRYDGASDPYVACRLWPSARAAARRANRDSDALRVAAPQSAAEFLGRSVRWVGERAYVAVNGLPGLVVGRTKEFVRFHDGRRIDAVVSLDALAAIAKVRRNLYRDLVLYVDPDGVHARWKRGRGGFNPRLRNNEAERDRESRTLLVVLSHTSHFPRGRWLGRSAASRGA